jgi:hypothetical protein
VALEDVALALIRKFGEDRTVSLLQPSSSPADPAKPWELDPTATETSTSAPAVVVPIRKGLIDGESIQAGDETVLIAGLSLGTIIPRTDDKILDEGAEKAIVAVQRIRPGKTDFLWKLQVRSA